MTENEKRLCSLQLMAYGFYQMDWCADRMIDIKEMDFTQGVNGECCVCFSEFKDNEFQEAEYMAYLLPKELYELYRELVLGEVTQNA